jgi:hypothetical protein
VRILERHYENNRKYVDFISTLTKDGTIPFNSLGDWLPWSSQTSEQFTGTIYFYNAVNILAKSAKILGKTEDAKKYAELAEKQNRLSTQNGLTLQRTSTIMAINVRCLCRCLWKLCRMKIAARYFNLLSTM